MQIEEKVNNALEEINKDADQMMSYVVYAAMAINFLCGLLYLKLFLGIVSCIITGGLFFGARYYVNHRLFKNSLVCFSLAALLLINVALTNGLIETRFLYFVLLFVLVFYQSAFLVHLSSVLAYIFTLFIFIYPLSYPESDLSIFFTTYFIEPKNLSIEKFIFSFASEVVAHIAGILVTQISFQRSLNNIYLTLNQEEQLILLEKNKKFADAIASGNLQVEYELSEEDSLGKSLLNMRDNLNLAAQKDEQEKYINFGNTEINEILRNESSDLKALSDTLMNKIVKYLGASQGAIYLVESEANQDIYLKMTACYAYERKKFINKRIEIGEGLIGQTYLEKLPIFLTKIPSSYQSIDIGLGITTPNCVLITPLLAQDRVVGILELASLEVFEEYKIKFIQRIVENIATTIISVIVNEETKKLYLQSKIATEELKAQEEEMRQNMEELEATQEELRRKQTVLESQNKKMQSNEAIMQKALMKAKDAEKTLQEKSAALEDLQKRFEESQGKYLELMKENELLKTQLETKK